MKKSDKNITLCDGLKFLKNFNKLKLGTSFKYSIGNIELDCTKVSDTEFESCQHYTPNDQITLS